MTTTTTAERVPAPFAAHVADTEPAPFDWAEHDRRQAEISANLAASIARWKETADKAFQFDALRGGGNV